MHRRMGLCTLLLLALTLPKCYVASGGAPGEIVGTTAPGRASPHYSSQHYPQQQQQQQHQQHQQQPHHQQQQHYTHPSPHQNSHNSNPNNLPAVGGSNSIAPVIANQHAIYHPGPGSGHMENRNSYNLLSEAMSQAVSNEFNSLGSGSADGACHADDLDCYSGNVQDRLGMEAIRTLHRQLDDDDNGNIDLSESDDFLREELKYDSGYEKRQKAFHFNDDMHISVKELWEAWLRSEVHNWTLEQTTDWLAQSVQLPQYVELFKIHKVTGATLPRLAVNNMHYVSNVLGIKDPIHKQKIALKAMDVVLFGPPRETGTRWKDYILVTLLLSAIIGCWYAYQQNKNAKRHLRRMAQDMEGLQRAEQSLQEMQKELERARMEQESVATEKMDLERRLKEAPSLPSSSSDLEVQQLKKEIEMLRTELSRAEIELVDNCWTPPPQLQSWLQYTYELESKNHLKKRIAAEKQLQCAREACEKLRKKRSSLVGAFVSTHGKSIDDVDRSIVEARNSLSDVTNELQERLHRWKQIEACLGFNIVNNNGLPYLENVLYGRNGGGSMSSNKGSRGRITSSTDDLDDESVQGMLDTYSRSSVAGGLGSSTIINSSSNTLRDDSSGSEDGGDNQSVQFYLGGAPSTTPSLINTIATAPQRGHLSLESINHIGSGGGGISTPSPLSTAAPSPGPTSPLSPPPLPPHNNAHSNFNLNDSQLLRSQSTELVPTEIYALYSRQQQQQQQQKQQQYFSSKSGSVSGSGLGLGLGGGLQSTGGSSLSGTNKKMVKQHSTASQQSSSSTSSSVQSAPSNPEASGGGGSGGGVGSGGKSQSPGRWSSHERIMSVHHEHQLFLHPSHQHQQLYQQQHQHLQLQQQQHGGDKEPILQPQLATSHTAAALQKQMSAALSLQSLCGKSQHSGVGVGGSGGNNNTTSATSTSAATITSAYSDPQLENPHLPPTSDSASLDGSNCGSLKKRKRRLRFPFGGGSHKKSTSGGSSGTGTGTGNDSKSKLS